MYTTIRSLLKREHYNCPGAGVHWCNDCTVSQKISCSYNVQVWKYYYDGISYKNAQNLCNICIPSNVELHLSDCNLSLLHWYRWQLPSAKCNVNSLQRKRKQVLEQFSLDVKKKERLKYIRLTLIFPTFENYKIFCFFSSFIFWNKGPLIMCSYDSVSCI